MMDVPTQDDLKDHSNRSDSSDPLMRSGEMTPGVLPGSDGGKDETEDGDDGKDEKLNDTMGGDPSFEEGTTVSADEDLSLLGDV